MATVPRRVRSLLQLASHSPGFVWLVAAVVGVTGFVASVRSIVVSFGWFDAIGAGTVLVLGLLLWLAWKHQWRLQQEIAVLTGRLDEQRAAGELQDRLRHLEREREEYERELFTIAMRSQRPITESIRVVYQVGDTAERDRTSVFHESVADDPALPIRWAILRAWSDGQGAVVRSFRELRDIEAYELESDEAAAEAPMKVLDVGIHDRSLAALAFFNSELTTVMRRWRWSYTWPGMWASLRERNTDWSEYDVRPPYNSRQRIKQLTVSFIFPSRARMPRVESVIGTPPCVQEPGSDPRTGGPVFTCRIGDPAPGLLHWNLKVAGWD